MKIAVFGIGYVGSVTATLLAERGNDVLGVDTNPTKVEMILRGLSPVMEPELPERLGAAVKNGRLTAVCDPDQARDWKVAFVCVGTPSGIGGQIDTSALEAVLHTIGRQIKQSSNFRVVAIRSTLLPHLIRDLVIPVLHTQCGSPPGTKYGLVVMPEFLREGTSVADFLDPPFTLIGESDSRAGDVAEELFQFIMAPVIRMGIEEAVMVKYASNAYHALKVAFANEVGLLCASEGIDGHNVMQAFCRDTKLNISSRYLSPGFAFGGSCLLKDTGALIHRARQVHIETPLLNSILLSNRNHLEHCIETVLATGRRRIGIFGITFKPKTDDLRESPMIALVEALIGKGKEVRIYDRQVELARLTGSNREFIKNSIPHIASLMKTGVEEVVAKSEVLVTANNNPDFNRIRRLKRMDQILIDFSREMAPLGEPISLT